MHRAILSTFLFLCLAVAFALPARADDSHAGYYYPEPKSRESYTADRIPKAEGDRRSRVGFTVGVNESQQKRGYAPRYHLFAKGAEAEKLIIVATGDGDYNTLYRLRALLASLTADARNTPLFARLEEPESFNFLDLCKLIGFTQVTISDGRDFAHRIDIF